jgi:outer membrane cobalamin receptor
MNMQKGYRCFFLLLVSMQIVIAQNNALTSLSGNVKDQDNNPLDAAVVHLLNTSYSTVTDENGHYALRVPAGDYSLACSQLGYIPATTTVHLDAGQSLTKDMVLVSSSNTALDEVIVIGKSKVREINESAYNVVAIDARALHNSTMDLAHALDRVSGVKIRETGGEGSNMQILLNGFGGRHVKVFMDGMPIESFGPTFRMGNIPVNLAERIEVYKGVVPVELGSDALGGAINIVTRQTSNTYLDASYSHGSFNTHKSNVNFGHATRKGVVFQMNVFQSYSDNNYKIKTNLLDLSTNRFSNEEYWFERFHDKYRSETAIVKAGLINKPWATRLMLGLTLSHEKADIQNANLMKIVFGGRERRAKSLIPSLNYEKKDLFVENLRFSMTANYNRVRNNNTDSLARQYNWKGEYRVKGSKGEGEYTLGEFDNESYFVTANLNYKISDRHYLALNNVYNRYTRKATDAASNAENSTAATFMTRTNAKNVAGISYKFEPNRKWNMSAFGKYYAVGVAGPIDTSSTTTAAYEKQERSFRTAGYGVAMTCLLIDALQLKVSFEKSCRLPTERELFGDEVMETGDASLKPENSRNVNFNLTYSNVFRKVHSFYFDAGFIYRDTRDYIRRQIEQRYGGAYYTNHGQVRNVGVDVEGRYFYKNTFSAGGNFTYQNMRNRKQYSPTGQLLVYYNDRMPNNPYLFGNFDIGYHHRNLFGRGDRLSAGYNLQYVHRFFRDWQSEGGDIAIPRQLSHDLNLTYALKDGRYNITFEVRNMTNELLYDNYSLQKPGRSFSVKLRYFIFKSE